MDRISEFIGKGVLSAIAMTAIILSVITLVTSGTLGAQVSNIANSIFG